MSEPKVYCAHDEIVDIDSLIENPHNPNKHPEKQLELLAKIITNQGWRNPITVSNRSGFIVKGHGRLQAAKMAGFSVVPVDRQDYDSEAAEWADMVADNRIAELADMNNSELKDLLEELDVGEFDMELTGFDEMALEDLMTQFHVEGIDAPNLSDEEKAPFQQMMFTLHDEQVEEVKSAISKALKQGAGDSLVNENSNGNALAFICGCFNNGES